MTAGSEIAPGVIGVKTYKLTVHNSDVKFIIKFNYKFW